MKKILFLLVIASTPCIASAYCVKNCGDTVVSATDNLKLADAKTLEFNGTVEKHLSKDTYQFIDQQGRVLAEIDGDTWRSQSVTEKDGVLLIG